MSDNLPPLPSISPLEFIGEAIMNYSGAEPGENSGEAWRSLVCAIHSGMQDYARAAIEASRGAVPAGTDVQWQKRHPLRTEGEWENANEHDAKWWRDHSQGWEIRVLYAHPVTQAKPEQAAQQWMPIETAPKDGTAVLVAEGRFIYCVEWNDEFEWWAVDDNKLGPFRLRGAAPTHWMPLPAAPQPKD